MKKNKEWLLFYTIAALGETKTPTQAVLVPLSYTGFKTERKPPSTTINEPTPHFACIKYKL